MSCNWDGEAEPLSSFGHIYPLVALDSIQSSLKACPWWCPWRLVLQACEKYLGASLPSSTFSDATLVAESWPQWEYLHLRNEQMLYTGSFSPQRAQFLILTSTTTAWSPKISPVSCVLCLCLSCSSGAEAEGWRPPLWGESGSEASRNMGHGVY